MTIQLPWPSRALSPNSRGHWATKAQAVKAARTVAFYATKESKMLPCVNFTLTFHPPTNRARDLDNLVASCKAYLDGMAQAWGVNDSAFRWTATIGEIVPGGRVLVEAVE
jgi:crossover junction endodeoxyribonuclease RusA